MFEDMWTTVDGCQEVISNAWEGLGSIVVKLKGCQVSLQRWNKEKVGSIPRQIRRIQCKLDDLQGRPFTTTVDGQHRV